MKEQLLLLLDLQVIDSRVHELRTEIQALPGKLEPAKKDLAKLDAIVEIEQAQLAENEAWRKEQEDLIQMEEEAIRKAKLKLQAAKNSKDYTAANRELDNKRKSKSDRESEVLKMMEALETSRADVEAHARDIESLRAHIAAEEERIKEVIGQMAAEAEERASGRDAIASQIEARLLKRYDAVMKKRGYAVASVQNGVCRGCHMAIPPQLNNVLARFDSIESCPRCHRLLYREEIMKTEEAADAS